MLRNMTSKAAVALFAGLFLIAGCEEEGPAEKVGEAVDETVEEVGDQAEEAADTLEEKTD